MESIKSLLEQIISSLFSVPDGFSVEVTPAPELDSKADFRADFATNVAMKLAGILHKNPRELAETLKSKFLNTVKETSPELSDTKIEIAGPGFMNFMLPDAYFAQEITSLSNNFEQYISSDDYKNQVIVTEFSDPNPFKVLHIGHLYTSIIGESISRLFEFAGGKVHRVNFGGDVGLHVAKTLYALEKKELIDFSIEDIAKCYVEGTRAYEEDEAAKSEITALNKILYEISDKNLTDSKLAKDYWHGRELSYKYFDDFYSRIGVAFEKYYPESSVASLGLETVKNHPDVYENSDGALVFKGEKYGLHTRVFVNREGLPTYESKDVGLLFTKAKDYSFDKSVVITGNDIIDYMKVVLKSIEEYAPELVEKTLHLTHGNVRLPGNEKMSSRKGNFIKAVDILNEVEEKTGSPVLALAAIKYGLLRYKIGGNIEFNIDESISTTGNSGIYLLYSAVRAKKILAGIDSKTPEKESLAIITAPELALAKSLLNYKTVVTSAIHETSPHLLCTYLYSLAQTFSKFYESCHVQNDPREKERIVLVSLFLKTMTHGLNLLGITIPEEM